MQMRGALHALYAASAAGAVRTPFRATAAIGQPCTRQQRKADHGSQRWQPFVRLYLCLYKAASRVRTNDKLLASP